jgi:hypothetical protein
MSSKVLFGIAPVLEKLVEHLEDNYISHFVYYLDLKLIELIL